LKKKKRPPGKRKRSVSPLKKSQKAPVKKRRVMTKSSKMTRQPSMSIMKGEKLRKSKVTTKLEIIFSFDTTGSMHDVLENVRKKKLLK
jgi:hypothetical protein